MRKLLLIAATVCTIFSSCSEGVEETGSSGGNEPNAPVIAAPEIKLETKNADFPTSGGSKEITFSSNRAWTAKLTNDRASEWCSITPKSGPEGNAKITISATTNETSDDRTATVVLQAEGRTQSIAVSQKQKDALTVTSSKFEVEAEGGEVKIEVKANIDFEYVIEESAQSWITYTGTRAMKTSTLSFKVAENKDSEKREAKIYIKSGQINEVVTIYQASSKPSIVISQNEYVVSSDGATIAVEVTSNVDVAVELPSNATWISENTTRATSTNTYRFDIAPSEEHEERSAEIKFINKANNLSEIVKVVQTQKDALVVAKDTYNVSGAGEQIQIEVGYNIDFDIEIVNDWITKIDTRAFTTETLTFNIAANPTNDSREGKIIFKSKDGKLSQTVKIYQTPQDALIISNKDIVVDSNSGTLSFDIQTNVEFKVGEPNVNWLRAVQTRGLTTHTLRYEYDANSSYDYREAKIVVTDNKNNKTETVTITQMQKDAIVLAKNSYTIDSEGGQIQIEVGHNVDFDIEIADDWITKVDTRAFTTETITFNIAANSASDSREGTIKFVSKDKNLTQEVNIVQEAYGLIATIAITVSSSEWNLYSYIESKFEDNVTHIIYEKGEYIITFAPGYNSIQKGAFKNCDWLNSVRIIENIDTVEQEAFAFCDNLTSVIIGDCVRELKSGESASYSIKYASNAQQSFSTSGVFTACENLSNVVLSKNLIAIEPNTFAGCRISELTIPDNVKLIGDWAFFNNPLHKINNGMSVITIGDNAFSRCSIQDLHIPNNVTEIGSKAFEHCYMLENITFSDSVISIGSYAFQHCRNLTSITIPSSVKQLGDGVFEACYSLSGFYGGYASSDNRCLIFNGKLIQFAGYGLDSYTIPNNVAVIGIKAFKGWDNLTNINIPNSVSIIDAYAFVSCSGLKNISLSDGIIKIGDYAFEACSHLENISIPEGVTEIGNGAFRACYGLTKFTIPKSVTKIGALVFQHCKNLKTIYCKPTTPPKLSHITAFASDATYNPNRGWDIETQYINTIYVPNVSAYEYMKAEYWSYYREIIKSYEF